MDRLLATRLGDALSRAVLESHVAGKVMVLRSRHAFGPRQNWPGLFSEFHSVLGALVYASQRRAAGVRVYFDAPNYVQAGMGANWWEYFFERSLMPLRPGPTEEVHLTRPLARYGRYFGFGGLVYGLTPYLYPMTFGKPRHELATIIRRHIAVRQEIRERVDNYVASHFAETPFTLGIHYRGTDTARHFPFYRLTYEAFLGEIRRVLESVSPPKFNLFIATDEGPFLDTVEREYPGQVLSWHESPRAGPGDPALHLNGEYDENFAKGESAIVDCLLLSRTDYLIKGRSNLSDASLAFNAELPYSFCIR